MQIPAFNKRRVAPAGQQPPSLTGSSGQHQSTGKYTYQRHQARSVISPGKDVLIGSSPAIRTIKRPLAAKQGTTSSTLSPLHTFPAEDSNEGDVRFDATANFATSLNANQPAATIVDRIRLYAGLDEDTAPQIGEVEGRALPAAAYMVSNLYEKTASLPKITPGSDGALANNVQKLAYYKAFGCMPEADYLIEDVIKVQPFGGVGALTSYAENDGASGRVAVGAPPLGSYFLARSLTVNQIGIRKATAFMIAAAVDFNAGFTIRSGGRSYVTEEINDIEDEILDEFGTAQMSITGAASAAPAGHGVRGQPQDPFTGAGVFLFGDVYDEPRNVSIIVAGAAVLLQIACINEQGLDAVRSA